MLAESDVSTLLDVVHDLVEPMTIDDLRERVVQRLPELIPNSMTSWNEVDVPAGTATVVSNPPPEPADHELRVRFARHIGTHPVVEHLRRTGDGRPHTLSDFLDAETYHAMPLYQEVYRHLEIEDQLSCGLPDPAIVVGIALNRPERSFDERERTLLNLSRPHLARARRSAQTFERTRWYLATLERLVEAAGEGLILAGRSGDVELATPNAAALLADWFPLEPGHHHGAPAISPTSAGVRLPEALVRWLGEPGRAPYSRTRGGAILTVDRLPGPAAGTVAMLLHESTPPGDGSLMLLRRTGLTGRQAEVLMHATSGATNAQIAARLGISARTVEKHLESAMDRLGVVNRVQATQLVRDVLLRPAYRDTVEDRAAPSERRSR